ncbi:lysine histidine transporter-like 8 [Zea mays]|uniref:Lysine histidine transporter-like 7 n=1 Tax=Zea mays TaxID=4577 RepID=K7TVT7_MAIZE|nr:lysine histidine transporter-like 8 [Zea mays]AQK45701.1 Lysine histidine transporter-like 7 [Zea mays]|eukprot:XP_008663510.1 lysine histidine transporter-like 8 [Zea mays]
MSSSREVMVLSDSEVQSAPPTPRPPQPVSAPPSQIHIHSPSPARSPLASPVRKAVAGVKGYLEEEVGGHVTRLADPRDAWLPVTESRSGNAYYAAFHSLSSGIGFQALVLPTAFASLGWTWAIICLTLAFGWQLYTLWLLVRLHEPVAGATRYSRYMHLATTVFGDRWANILALLPVTYLSAGICTALIIVGGGSMKMLFGIACGGSCLARPLTAVEWYLVFVCAAVVLSQLPNLNSIAGVSLVAAAAAVAYCTMIWAVSVARGRVAGVSYDPVHKAPDDDVDAALGVLNGLGIIAFAFRGHNVVLEIQGTMPSTLKHPSHVPMWKGVKVAYAIIALCLYPIAIGGFWAYGNQIPPNGILSALYKFHSRDASRLVLGVTTLLVIINCLTTYQIYAMPVYDNMEAGYVHKKNRPCPWWMRSGFRAFFGAVNLLVAVALPFLSELAGLFGGISLPVTLAYPCFMWVAIKKPRKGTATWNVNWALGILGMSISLVLIVGNLWGLVEKGMRVKFFKPADFQ